MSDQPRVPSPAPAGLVSPRAAAAVTVAVVACTVYANLALAVKDPADYRFFPPFRANINMNVNLHPGGEFFNMARSLAEGEGFSHPFQRPTGPTSWQPPVVPLVLAGLLRACDGNPQAVGAVLVVFQVPVLIGTGLLVLAVARRTTRRLGAGVVAAAYVLVLLAEFGLWFQVAHLPLTVLVLDVLLAGLGWGRPLGGWRRAVAWGLFGGLAALVSPILGFTWAVCSLPAGLRRPARARFLLAALTAGLVVAPWAVRNYLVFGRLIPLKSNLAYELYQSQCLQPDGLIQITTFAAHPANAQSPEGREYQALGETAYLDRKREQFRQAVQSHPGDFAERVAERFLGVTLWYVPFNRTAAARRPWILWAERAVHPLPFLGLLVLLATAGRQPLHRAEWAAIGIYAAYLLPYVVASYYDRYGASLLAVKVLLVLWAADRLLSLGRGAWSSGPFAGPHHGDVVP
jgi:hypothetical protein